jgi:hypothetical protein
MNTTSPDGQDAISEFRVEGETPLDTVVQMVFLTGIPPVVPAFGQFVEARLVEMMPVCAKQEAGSSARMRSVFI